MTPDAVVTPDIAPKKEGGRHKKEVEGQVASIHRAPAAIREHSPPRRQGEDKHRQREQEDDWKKNRCRRTPPAAHRHNGRSQSRTPPLHTRRKPERGPNRKRYRQHMSEDSVPRASIGANRTRTRTPVRQKPAKHRRKEMEDEAGSPRGSMMGIGETTAYELDEEELPMAPTMNEAARHMRQHEQAQPSQDSLRAHHDKGQHATGTEDVEEGNQVPFDPTFGITTEQRTRRLEALLRWLPRRNEPLRTAVHKFRWAAAIPDSWCKITFAKIHSANNRQFAKWLRAVHYALFAEFVRGDINILTRDKRIRTTQQKGCTMAKFNIGGRVLRQVLKIPLLGALNPIYKSLPRVPPYPEPTGKVSGIHSSNQRDAQGLRRDHGHYPPLHGFRHPGYICYSRQDTDYRIYMLQDIYATSRIYTTADIQDIYATGH